MAGPPTEPGPLARLAALPLILEWALGLRILAADLLQWTRSKGELCVFRDSDIYWYLAGKIARGEPYEVNDWGDLPHFALRTPGYPLFLAACRALFGDRPLPARLVQAVLGAVCVWLVYRLTARLDPAGPEEGGRGWTAPLAASALAAFHPYLVATSALLLSEAVFLPLMLAGLWGLAAAWAPAAEGARGRWWPWSQAQALGAGAAWGAAVLVRPSWALFVPAALLAWVAAPGRGRRLAAVRGALLVALGFSAVMSPWWVRNARIYGRFVPTALWSGASLYDGLNPRATGASDMDFREAPEFWPLDEETQDAVLRDRAWAFARSHPGRVAELAALKFARYWSPWPNASGFRSPLVAIVSAAWTLPLYGLILRGAWQRRRDVRALVLSAGPLLYFCALHMVFASSMRYRVPAEMPALALAGLGLAAVRRRGRP